MHYKDLLYEKKRCVRRTSRPRYEIGVVINEQPVAAFADTGADVSVMSEKVAKQLGLHLTRTRMKIEPYGSKIFKCKGCFVGTIMLGEAMENVSIYVKQKVEMLLSGGVSEVQSK